jgi:hypothetical protein
VARKTKAPAKGKRYPLNMRTTLELRQKIEEAAEWSGRSLVQEVEHRLEESFLKSNLAALMREHIDNAAKAAAEKAVEKLLAELNEK